MVEVTKGICIAHSYTGHSSTRQMRRGRTSQRQCKEGPVKEEENQEQESVLTGVGSRGGEELGRGGTRTYTATGRKTEHVGASDAQRVDIVMGAWGGLF